MAAEAWSSLEVAKLAVGALGPISVALLGWFISRRVRDFEHDQWKNQKAIEKRIEIFDKLAPDVNRMYCYFMWIGDWQRITPEEVVLLKRTLDKGFYVNRYIIGEDVFKSFQKFVHLLFSVFDGRGQQAKIRSQIVGSGGDRPGSKYFEWKPEWNDFFDEAQTADTAEVHRKYVALMQAFKKAIGVG